MKQYRPTCDSDCEDTRVTIDPAPAKSAVELVPDFMFTFREAIPWVTARVLVAVHNMYTTCITLLAREEEMTQRRR